ncbi:hypothetical protein V1520DRAFT_91082 [Lipomyces starkeyi]
MIFSVLTTVLADFIAAIVPIYRKRMYVELAVSSDIHAALQFMSIDNRDGYMRECLQYSTNCKACITARTSQPLGGVHFHKYASPIHVTSEYCH